MRQVPLHTLCMYKTIDIFVRSTSCIRYCLLYKYVHKDNTYTSTLYPTRNLWRCRVMCFFSEFFPNIFTRLCRSTIIFFDQTNYVQPKSGFTCDGTNFTRLEKAALIFPNRIILILIEQSKSHGIFGGKLL